MKCGLFVTTDNTSIIRNLIVVPFEPCCHFYILNFLRCSDFLKLESISLRTAEKQLAFMSFLGLLAVGRQFIKANSSPRVPWSLELLAKCLFHIILKGRRGTVTTHIVKINIHC